MSKNTDVKEIIYRVSGTGGLVHRFSPYGYELLSDEFMSYMERIRPMVCDAESIRLVVKDSGCSKEEREAANRALRFHYCLRLSDAENALKKGLIRIAWFLLSLALSASLLLVVGPKTNEVATQFLYLPFWFFGYRILIYAILDLPVVVEDRKWLKKLANLTLVFQEENQEESDVYKGFSRTLEKDGKVLRLDAFVREYFMEGEDVMLECAAEDYQELLCQGLPEGEELISDEMAAYLEQAIPFLEKEHSVRLKLMSEEGIEQIQRGIRNHFSLRIAETDSERKENRKHIVFFAVGLFFVSLLLYALGSRLELTYHEVVMIFLWFFGDYLVEFILLTPKELGEMRAKWVQMRDMKIAVDD